MIKTTTLFIISILCAYISYGQTIKVAVASSLAPVMEEIKSSFEAQNKQKVQIISSGSGTLSHQISMGAPFDIFISADSSNISFIKKQLSINNDPEILAKGQLALWFKPNFGTIELALHNAKTIGIPQPELAPYGMIGMNYINIEHPKILDKKIIYGKNVSLTNQYIYTQSVDIVLTSYSSMLYLQNKIPCCWYKINDEKFHLNHIAILINSKANPFFEFLLTSKEAKQKLQKFGYILP